MLSIYPGTQDTFYNRIDAITGGTSVIESLTVTDISPFMVSLNHSISSSSLVTIPGYISTSSNPPTIPDRFYIDYEDDELIFNSSSANQTLSVTYLSDGDDILAEDVNFLQDAITQIQSTLGTNPQSTYTTVKAFLAYLLGKFDYLTGHQHTGTSNDAPLLTVDAISGLSIQDRHVATLADIDPSKIGFYDPNIVSTSGSTTLQDTLDWLYSEINEVSTSAGVQSITPFGGTEVTGDITFIGDGGVSLSQDGDNIHFSTSTAQNHTHYCQKFVVTEQQAIDGIILLTGGQTYVTGNDSMMVEWQRTVCDLDDEYQETDTSTITFNVSSSGNIEVNDRVVLRWQK